MFAFYAGGRKNQLTALRWDNEKQFIFPSESLLRANDNWRARASWLAIICIEAVEREERDVTSDN